MPIPPVIACLLCALLAVALGVLGSIHLTNVVEAHAERRCAMLTRTLGARLDSIKHSLEAERAASPDAAFANAREILIRNASQVSGAEYAVVAGTGQALASGTSGVLSMRDAAALVLARRGQTQRPLGRTYFEATALASPNEFLIVMVPVPPVPLGDVIRPLVGLCVLLLSAAAVVAYLLSREITRDVEFVSRRVKAMADTRSEAVSELVPIRAIDEVGVLTVAFNELVGQFKVAERAYRTDLDRARSVDRERAAFLAAVSHELRSPLNAILGFADVLMNEVDGELTPSAREGVEQIKGSGERLLELISDILEFSALESGQLRLKCAIVDIANATSSVVRELAVTVRGKPVVLRLEAPAPVMAYVDPRRFRQIVQNLVGNALKFTQSGQVVVSVWSDLSRSHVSVADTGPGIRAEDQQRIFLEYQQSRDESRKTRGSGLGLAITRRLVELHGGKVVLASELGRGSVFSVDFPCTAPERPDHTGRFFDPWTVSSPGVRR